MAHRIRSYLYCVGAALLAAIMLLAGSSTIAAPPKKHSAEREPLVIDTAGCHYPVEVERALKPLPSHSDMREHLDTRLARFAFGPLHGVGVGKAWDAEWSGERLYFAEDVTAVIAYLRHLGFRIDRHGQIAIPPKRDDNFGLTAEVLSVGPRNKDRVRDAHSTLSCGSF